MRVERIKENGKTYKVRVHDNGTKWWYLNGKLHRENGPAIERADGTKCWFLNDKYHREDGPAVEWANGTKYWYLNGELHREDGPSIERADGIKYWHLNSEQLTEEEFNKRTNPDTFSLSSEETTAVGPCCDGKVVEIDGKKHQPKSIKEQEECHTKIISTLLKRTLLYLRKKMPN